MVTGTETETNASRSTSTFVGASINSMLGSLFVIDIGIEYVPARLAADQSTETLSTAGLSVASVF